MANIAKVSDEYYLDARKIRILKDEPELANFLLQMSTILNAVVDWLDEHDKEQSKSKER